MIQRKASLKNNLLSSVLVQGYKIVMVSVLKKIADNFYYNIMCDMTMVSTSVLMGHNGGDGPT